MHKKAIFFDLYQTLINVDTTREKEGQKDGFEKVIIPYLLSRGISESEALLVLSYYSDEVQTFYNEHNIEIYHHNFPKILSEVFQTHYNFTIPHSELSDLLYEFRKISRGYLEIYKGVREVLEILSAKYTLAIASYTQGIYSERELEEVGILKYFTYRIYSSDIGFKKRSNNFFEKCLEVVGLEANDCVMVGDNLYEDMFMAHQNGMHTLWIVNPLTKERNPAEVTPEATVPLESIGDLPSVTSKILN